MARYTEPTEEQLTGWREWVEQRPDGVRQLAERFNPWTLYLLKTTGQRVTIAAFDENGTVRVNVSGEFNLVSHERSVFGINPDDLEECDLPSADEPLGTFDLPIEEVRAQLAMSPEDRKLKMLDLILTRAPRTYPRV
jgi:hypothetical protein